MSDRILSVSNLVTRFGATTVLEDVSFDVGRGEFLAVVGESGSGKSVTALSILRLLQPPGHVAGGQVLFNGTDLLGLSERRMRAVRGRQISMIFQEPLNSLNPMFTIGDQIVETLRHHEHVSATDARRRAIEMLDRVGIPSAAERIDEHPHRMSGGMRQRVMIAMALVCRPDLVIADEPTTALDVTIQAQILELLRDLRRDFGLTVIFITHDLGVVAEIADRVVVMYAGRAVEIAPTLDLFDRPAHPYTEGLMRSMPALQTRRTRLHAIEGVVPAATAMPPGCRFHPRCIYAHAICHTAPPVMRAWGEGHLAACHGREAPK
jgi:oligopeptide/dipeptide ABC transporter ATP-binding protein